MLGLRVEINNLLVPTETVEELKAIGNWLLNTAAVLERSCPAEPEVPRRQNDKGKGTRDTKGLDAWIEKAWEALGKPEAGATGEQFLEAAKGLGFVPTADDPIPAFTASVRQHPRSVQVGKIGRTVLWRLNDTAIHEQTAPPTLAPAATDPDPSNTPTGQSEVAVHPAPAAVFQAAPVPT